MDDVFGSEDELHSVVLVASKGYIKHLLTASSSVTNVGLLADAS